MLGDTSIPLRHLEFVDVTGGRVWTCGRKRKSTLQRLRANAQIIEALWSSL